MCGNKVGAKGYEKLKYFLRKSKDLVGVGLGDLSLSKELCEDLLTVLASCDSIRILDLSFTSHLRQESAQSPLRNLLTKAVALQEVILAGIPFDEDSLESIMLVLKENEMVEKLDFSDVKWFTNSADMTNRFGETLARVPQIKEIRLLRTAATIGTLKPFLHRLSKAEKLTFVDFSDNVKAKDVSSSLQVSLG
tara:strand:- start:812 stop:1390 length:579 start_codon:yes stop_codon:yes gene_type:complete